MSPRRLDRPSFFLSLVLVLGGAGMLAAVLAIMAGFGQAQIRLQRDSGAIQGSIRWVFCGVPIFWRSLDGLERVERADYETTVESSSRRGSSTRNTRTVARASFRGAEGRELTWVERTAVINEVEHIQRFLTAGQGTAVEATDAPATSFEFKESPGRWNWDRIKNIVFLLFIIPLLLVAGLLCLLAGGLSLWRWFVPPS